MGKSQDVVKPDQFRAKILNYYKGDREQWMQK